MIFIFSDGSFYLSAPKFKVCSSKHWLFGIDEFLAILQKHFALKNCLIFCQINKFFMLKFVREKWFYYLPKVFVVSYKVNI